MTTFSWNSSQRCLLVAGLLFFGAGCAGQDSLTASTEAVTETVIDLPDECFDDDAEFAPISRTYDQVEDWWRITSVDGERFAELAAEEGSGPAVVRGTGLSGIRMGADLDEIWIDHWHADTVRLGVEAGDEVFVATQADIKSVVISVVSRRDGAVVFGGGPCATPRHIRSLQANHGADVSATLGEFTSLTGRDLALFVGVDIDVLE